MNTTEEKRQIIEDVCGEFGFRLVWSVSQYWADVTAYEVESIIAGQPEFLRRDYANSSDTVASHTNAEPYLTGYIKWDGCAELNQGCPHWCGAHGFKKHCDLLRVIYEHAMQHMAGADVSEKWPE